LHPKSLSNGQPQQFTFRGWGWGSGCGFHVSKERVGVPELIAEATMAASSRVLASIFLHDVDHKVEKMYVTKESLKKTFN
jgi:hypothetical protein